MLAKAYSGISDQFDLVQATILFKHAFKIAIICLKVEAKYAEHAARAWIEPSVIGRRRTAFATRQAPRVSPVPARSVPAVVSPADIAAARSRATHRSSFAAARAFLAASVAMSPP